MTKSLTSILGLCVALLAGAEQARKYNPSPTQWIEIPVPPKARAADRAVWAYAGNYSKHEWHVRRAEHLVRASLVGDRERSRDRISISVAGGTVIAINRGEWGGTLLFRPKGGKREKVVSKDQVVAFVQLSDALYAVEGLAHLSISRGSILRIDQTAGGWKTTRIAKLPAAPYAATIRSDGSLIITLADGVVAYDASRGVRRIIGDAPWSGLYPNSSALAADDRHLYVGMRQYVAEVDLPTRRVRMLVPSRAFLNRLSPSDEHSVRSRFVY